MEDLLKLRYSELFAVYNVSNRPILKRIKKRLERSMERPIPGYLASSPRLRPDAALCLLALYDQMIVRPYSAKFPGIPIPKRGRSSSDFWHSVERSLAAIFSVLRQSQRRAPYSSHDILKAINRAWPKLQVIFGWA
jgi:hypothetical protein